MIDDTVLKVRDVNKYIKTILEYDPLLNNLAIEGEISNYKRHSSGHLYFSLKDSSGKISCVMFKGNTYSLKFEPEDGMNVIVRGSISVFEKNGNYQLYVNSIEKKGTGALYEKYLKLLEELKQKGYFDENKKKKIPEFPNKVAVVTSKTGAVIKDIISVISRRNPMIEIIICPVSVQGEGSSEEISNMIRYINQKKLADCIITGRGGGSIEELWSFNEENVANAIYDSEIPVISAVGHETDFTICDFVSDMRAPTPSVAGELVSTPISEIFETLQIQATRLKRIMTRKIDDATLKLDYISSKNVFTKRDEYINTKFTAITLIENKISQSIHTRLNDTENKINNLEKYIEGVSVQNVLNRGFALIEKENKIITSLKNVSKNDKLKITMKDEYVYAKVEDK